MTEAGGEAFLAALVHDDPEQLYEQAPCAYLSCLPDGTIIKVNQTLLSWLDAEAGQLLGRRFQSLLAPGDRIFYETHYGPLLAMQGRVREIAVEVVRPDGRRLPVLANSVLARDAAGEPAFIRTVLFDATERRAYEQELLAARDRAEESERRARALARTLQTSLLPPELVELPGVELAGAYRPAGDGTQVGGDFYDVFENGDGTASIVLGDVCGKGPEAAALTALARYTVRAEAIRSTTPSAVLGALHRALARYHPDRFCTAVLLRVEPRDGEVAITVAAGGHHLPLVRRHDGTVHELGRHGSLIGMLDDVDLHDESTRLTAGDMVVLFTDGVLEARREGDFFDQRRLREAIHRVAHLPAAGVADSIVDVALDFQGGSARDDIAVLVIRVP